MTTTKFIIYNLQTAANGYRTLNSITLNIDGEILALKPYADSSNKDSSDEIYVKTHLSFAVSLTLLNKIEQSANTRIKIVTDVGVIEADFKESRTFLGLVHFNKQVLKCR